MKKIFTIICLLTAFFFEMSSKTFEHEGILYRTTSETECETYSVNKDKLSENVVIPEHVSDGQNLFTVNVIGDNTFSNCDEKINSIDLPRTITSMSGSAFNHMHDLSRIIIRNPNINITGSVNYNYLGADDLTIDLYIDSLEEWCSSRNQKVIDYINDYREKNQGWFPRMKVNYFYQGKEIENLTIPMGVKVIGDGAFACNQFKKIVIPDGLEKIGDDAFSGSPVSDIIFPEGLKSIGNYAFANCRNLKDFDIPESVTSIGKYAFQYCEGISKITLPSTITELGTGVFSNCADLETIIFPKELESLPDEICHDCDHLTTVVLPENLKHIGNSAFRCIRKHLKIYLPSTLESIGDYAFETGVNMPVMLEINLPENLLSIGEHAFSGRNLGEIKLPQKLNFIGSSAFQYNDDITSLEIPGSIKTISRAAFAEMYNLQYVTIAEGVEEIGEYAFACDYYSPYFKSLESLKLPMSLKKIGDKAFLNKNLTTLIVPDNVSEVGSNILGSNLIYNMKYIRFGKGITSIGNLGCNGDVMMIQIDAATPPVLGADRLGTTPKMVLVPEGCGDIYKADNRWKDYFIVAKNSAVANVYVSEPGTLASEIRTQSGFMPAAVTNLIVEGPLNDSDFAIMRSNMTSCYDINLEKVTNTVIPAGAFRDKITLSEFVFPSKLTKVGSGAFSGCATLHFKSLPESLETILYGAFENCISLDNDLCFPESFSDFSDGAFEGCSTLKSLDISRTGMTYIPKNAFAGCSSLENVILPSTLNSIGENAFKDSGIASISGNESLQSIGASAFSGTRNLKSFDFNEGLEEIGNNAFGGSGLQSVDLPSSITAIGEYVFNGSDIVYINFGNNITSIGSGAVASCDNLMVVNLPSKLTEIAGEALASPSLTAVNSPSVEPAICPGGNPFTGIDNLNCALSIPRQSFTKYLISEYWGSFVGMRNSIDVTIPEDVDVTYMNEEDYQQMVSEDPADESPADGMPRRISALKAMKRDGVVSDTKGYGKVFNGASLYRNEDAGIRFFIDAPDYVTDIRVLLDGKDVTSSVVDNMFVVSGSNSTSTLEIKGKNTMAEEIWNDSVDLFANGAVDVYDLTGVHILRAVEESDFDKLSPGIYIAGGRKIVISRK